MATASFRQRPAGPAIQSGISLIIVLIMVVVIGLTSAAAIRNASSGEKLTDNIRLQNLAQQYAEAALRYCEAELSKADGVRVATLAEANIIETPLGAAQADTGWGQALTWTGNGGASASLTVVPEAAISSADSAFRPTTRPQCVAERQLMADGNRAYVITARGFSPGYTADPGTGRTLSGSVVWLQSMVSLN